LNLKQRALRTKWGMASNDISSLRLALPFIPIKYKRIRRMIEHQIKKLGKKMKETEKDFSYMGD